MDKGGILGGIAEELGQTLKKGGKTAMEQVAGTGAYKPAKTPPQKIDLSAMKTEEDEEKIRNLAIVRQRLAQQMTPPPKRPEPRPAERVEMKKQQELQELQKREEKKKPLAVQRATQKVEKYRGISG